MSLASPELSLSSPHFPTWYKHRRGVCANGFGINSIGCGAQTSSPVAPNGGRAKLPLSEILDGPRPCFSDDCMTGPFSIGEVTSLVLRQLHGLETPPILWSLFFFSSRKFVFSLSWPPITIPVISQSLVHLIKSVVRKARILPRPAWPEVTCKVCMYVLYIHGPYRDIRDTRNNTQLFAYPQLLYW